MISLRSCVLGLCAVPLLWAMSARSAEPDAREVSYGSPAVGRTLKYAVLLPQNYAQGRRRYPVLYLLHGHTGNYLSWLTYAKLPPDAATRLGALIVLADGGNGFYTNWHGAKGAEPNRWEDAIVEDLVNAVDARWRTSTAREHRAIGGLSMGGFGAVSIALRHAERFSFAFSSAGALAFPSRAQEEIRNGTRDWNAPEQWSKDERPSADVPGFATQAQRTPRGTVFVTEAQARAVDPFVLAEAMNGQDMPYIHLDCGLGDGLLPETTRLADVLRRRGAAHSLTLLPGDHETPYWSQAFEHTLLIVRAHFMRAGDRQRTGDSRRRRSSREGRRGRNGKIGGRTSPVLRRTDDGRRDVAGVLVPRRETLPGKLFSTNNKEHPCYAAAP